jgi:hypothetical protein
MRDTGVPQVRELVAFADATIGAPAETLDQARDALIRALGADAMIDAAAVIGGFDGITKIADATGIPLETPKIEQTADLRGVLQLDEFAAAKWWRLLSSALVTFSPLRTK